MFYSRREYTFVIYIRQTLKIDCIHILDVITYKGPFIICFAWYEGKHYLIYLLIPKSFEGFRK